MKSKRIIICFFVLMLCITSSFTNTKAHNRGQHNKDLEDVLFGNLSSSVKATDAKREAVERIEDAVYLAVDQYSGNGKEKLKKLRKYKVKKLPKTIGKIDFSGNSNHRKYTHLGWNHVYDDDKGNWTVRKEILIQTVDRVFTYDSEWFPFDLISTISKSDKEKRDAFCALLYYVHIIGDIIHAANVKDRNTIQLIEDRQGNQGVIPELIKYCEILFKDQSGYTELKHALNNSKNDVKDIKQSYDDLDDSETEAKEKVNIQYKECAEHLMKYVLKEKIHKLLKEQSYFKNVFYD